MLTTIPEFLYRYDERKSHNQQFINHFIDEMVELHNTDIWETLHETILKDHKIFRKYGFEKVLYNIRNNDVSINYLKKIGIDISDALFETLGYRINYCVWLTSLHDAQKYYEDASRELMKVKTSPVILSDIGDAMLFGYQYLSDIKMIPIDWEMMNYNQ